VTEYLRCLIERCKFSACLVDHDEIFYLFLISLEASVHVVSSFHLRSPCTWL